MSDKSKIGRPSSFDPDFCEMLIEHMSQGLSFESFGAVAECCKQTLYTWTENFPEFLDAKRRGTEKSRMFWEKLGIDHVINITENERNGNSSSSFSKSLNGTVWVYNMKNRFGWRDKQPDEASDVTVKITNLSDEEINAKIEEKMKKLAESE